MPDFTLRPHQVIPPGSGIHRIDTGDHGDGKTFAGAVYIAACVKQGLACVLMGPNYRHIDEDMMKITGGLRMLMPDLSPRKITQSVRLTMANGSLTIVSIDDLDRLYGQQFSAGWGDELLIQKAPFSQVDQGLNRLRAAVRLPPGRIVLTGRCTPPPRE